MAKIAGKSGMVSPEQAKSWPAARQKEGKFKKEEFEWSGLGDYRQRSNRRTEYRKKASRL